ncbi:MAG: DUF433 domain-containing protein [Dehalococcoidia bacterium]
MTATGYTHIELREGVPYIAGTPTKVRMLVVVMRSFGWGAEELQRQFPNLTLAQVYAALTYYHDHKEEIDREIEEGERTAKEMRPRVEEPQVRARFADAKRRASTDVS